jgi:uncharacterized protein YfaT (DUF1175 family)
MPSVLNGAATPADYAPTFVSADASAAQPGDLLLFDNDHLPAHVMVYIGSSQVVPSSCRWVIYVASGRVHKVKLDTLLDGQAGSASPEFRGVWRLDILGDID